MKTRSGNERPEPTHGQAYWVKEKANQDWILCMYHLEDLSRGSFIAQLSNIHSAYFLSDHVYDFIHIPKPIEEKPCDIEILINDMNYHVANLADRLTELELKIKEAHEEYKRIFGKLFWKALD